MGEFTAPEGYTLDPDYNVSSDSLEQNFYFTANDENALIQSVYVSGVRNRGAAEMVEMVAEKLLQKAHQKVYLKLKKVIQENF